MKTSGENVKLFTLSAEKKLAKAFFDGFVDGCSESKRCSNIELRAMRRMKGWRLSKAFQAWIYFMQVQAQKKMANLQEQVARVEKENERVKTENQRLAHVIDSGNWGKERVTELVEAGQVLTGERDALARLLGRMQRQHLFAIDQQKKHEAEVQELKMQLMGKKHLVRNKLLVKGASSFNSLVKAMKDDVLKNGNDPEILYTIDKLAMDEVTVYPDGDLRVKPMKNFDKGKGQWSPYWSRHSSPSSNAWALAPEPTQPPSTPPIRAPTPVMRPARFRTPTKRRAGENETGLASKPSPGTPKYVRSKTPMRGRPGDHFNYDQKRQSVEPESLIGTITKKDPEKFVEEINDFSGWDVNRQPGSTPPTSLI